VLKPRQLFRKVLLDIKLLLRWTVRPCTWEVEHPGRTCFQLRQLHLLRLAFRGSMPGDFWLRCRSAIGRRNFRPSPSPRSCGGPTLSGSKPGGGPPPKRGLFLTPAGKPGPRWITPCAKGCGACRGAIRSTGCCGGRGVPGRSRTGGGLAIGKQQEAGGRSGECAVRVAPEDAFHLLSRPASVRLLPRYRPFVAKANWPGIGGFCTVPLLPPVQVHGTRTIGRAAIPFSEEP
jgi:hypothetical protein